MIYSETFHHEADIGVRGIGATPSEAFAQAALALTSVITDPAAVRCVERVSFRMEAPELDLLLLDFLNALIYEMATRRMLFGECAVVIDGPSLRAEACGERVDRVRHAPAVEVKGATFTELQVRQGEDGQWLAQCVVDV